jgi:hypothetical protein
LPQARAEITKLEASAFGFCLSMHFDECAEASAVKDCGVNGGDRARSQEQQSLPMELTQMSEDAVPIGTDLAQGDKPVGCQGEPIRQSLGKDYLSAIQGDFCVGQWDRDPQIESVPILSPAIDIGVSHWPIWVGV